MPRQDERPWIVQQTLASTGVDPYQAPSRLFASGEWAGVYQVEAGGEEWVVRMSPLAFGGGCAGAPRFWGLLVIGIAVVASAALLGWLVAARD